MDAIQIEVDSSGIDEAIQKVEALSEKIKKARTLAGELASFLGELSLKNDNKKFPDLPEIIEEHGKLTSRFGKTEIVQTAGEITLRVQCTSRPDSVQEADLNKQ